MFNIWFVFLRSDLCVCVCVCVCVYVWIHCSALALKMFEHGTAGNIRNEKNPYIRQSPPAVLLGEAGNVTYQELGNEAS